MYSQFLTIAALCCSIVPIAAFPYWPKGWHPNPKNPGKTYDASFDDLTAVSAVSILPVGQYKELDFQGMLTTELGVAGIIAAGLVPNSASNVAASGFYSQLLNGQPALSADYDGSDVSFFDLKSFYYGCVVTSGESAAGVPTSCSITATGKDRYGNTIATQTFRFTGSGLKQNMAKGIFSPAFRGVSEVTFDTANDLLLSTLYDDFVYTVYKDVKYPF